MGPINEFFEGILNMITKLFTICITSIILFSLSACSLFTQKTRFIELPNEVNIHLNASYDVNKNSPVHVFLVLAYDKALLAKIKGLSAKIWSENYKQILNDNPRGLIIKNWEVIPGQQVFYKLQPINRRRIVGILAFANYQTKGSHRKSVLAFSKLTVNLKDKNYLVDITD